MTDIIYWFSQWGQLGLWLMVGIVGLVIHVLLRVRRDHGK